MAKVIWHKAASAPRTNLIVFARRCHYAPPSNTWFLGPIRVHPQTRSRSVCEHSRMRSLVTFLYTALYVCSTGVYCLDKDDFSKKLQEDTEKILGVSEFQVCSVPWKSVKPALYLQGGPKKVRPQTHGRNSVKS